MVLEEYKTLQMPIPLYHTQVVYEISQDPYDVLDNSTTCINKIVTQIYENYTERDSMLLNACVKTVPE